jgi:parvulin-like peptidyl-prolyl isomerase
MSASQEKKLRKQLRAEGKDKRLIAQEKEEKARRRSRTVNWIVGVVVALGVLAMIVFNSSLFFSNFTAVKVGDTSYTAAEYSFFYKYSYNKFVMENGSYLSWLGLDTSQPLSSQQYVDGQTWADFFKEAAQNTMKEVTALYDEAQKGGFTLSEEDRATLDSDISSYEEAYKSAGFASTDAYLAAVFGKGCTLEVVSGLLEKLYISETFSQEKYASYTYTDSELSAYYAENKDDLDNYTYLSFYASGGVSEEDAASADGEALKAAAMAEAKRKAEAVGANAETVESFKAAALAEGGSEATETTTQGSSLTAAYADWMKDAGRRAGDSTVIETDTGCYALYFLSRDDNRYSTVNVRHILIKAVADENGEYSDEAKAEAKASAEAILNEWQSGSATEDSFAELANEKTEDTGSNTNGGLYENVTKGRMVKEFNDWCFDADRKSGDTGIVYGESSSYTGYHVMYFVGKGEVYADLLAENGLVGKDFTAWKDALLANYELTTGFTAKLVK